MLDDEAYPQAGLITLIPQIVEAAGAAGGSILGTAPRHDPFRVRTISSENFVEEIDRSDELLERLRTENIDAAISIVGGSSITGLYALSVAFKLSRKGLPTICIPKSVENDIAPSALSFGYDSALSYTTETLERWPPEPAPRAGWPSLRFSGITPDGWPCSPQSPSAPMRCSSPESRTT